MSDGRDEYLGIVLAGWVMALCLPVGGIVACVLLDKRRPGHALGIGLVSVASLSAMVLGYLFWPSA
jgi:hypothetical protein